MVGGRLVDFAVHLPQAKGISVYLENTITTSFSNRVFWATILLCHRRFDTTSNQQEIIFSSKGFPFFWFLNNLCFHVFPDRRPPRKLLNLGKNLHKLKSRRLSGKIQDPNISCKNRHIFGYANLV